MYGGVLTPKPWSVSYHLMREVLLFNKYDLQVGFKFGG